MTLELLGWPLSHAVYVPAILRQHAGRSMMVHLQSSMHLVFPS